MKKNLKVFKNIFIYIILILLIIYKSTIIQIISNLNYLSKNITCNDTETKLLNIKINNLNHDLSKLTNLTLYSKYNYSLTRMSFKESYNTTTFYIQGGKDKDYKVNNLLINEHGVVGIITKVMKDYSICKYIYDTNNVSVSINNNYGIINGYKDDLIIIDKLSNYDNISLNDEVYTSSLGSIKEKLYIGTVYKIEEGYYNKKVYVKSEVNYDDISYLYVVGSK